MRIDRLNLVNYSMKLLGSPKPYFIRDWAALNQEDYREFQNLNGIVPQIRFLESRLWKSLSYFAKGVGFPQAEQAMEVIIDDLPFRRVVTLHGQKVSSFDVKFRANLPTLLAFAVLYPEEEQATHTHLDQLPARD